jgi:hypothetical protein
VLRPQYQHANVSRVLPLRRAVLAIAILGAGCGPASPKVPDCVETSTPLYPDAPELAIKTLQTMGEASLCSHAKRAASDVTYRVAVMPSFGRPRVARLWRSGGTWKASLTILQGYESREPATRSERSVSEENADKIESLIAEYDPWRHNRRALEESHDGTRWFVEALTNRGYAVVAALSPRDNLERAARALLAAAGDDCADCYPPSN